MESLASEAAEENQVDSDLCIDFARESTPKLEGLEDLILSLEVDPQNSEIPKEIYRILHTLKGTAACIGLSSMAHFAHRFEDFIAPLREGNTVIGTSASSLMLDGVRQLRQAMETLLEGKVTSLSKSFWEKQSLQHQPIAENASFAAGQGEKSAPIAKSNHKISVELEAINHLMEKSGNLMVLKDLLLQDLRFIAEKKADFEVFKKSLSYLESLERENDDLQKFIDGIRLTKISGALRAVQRATRDLSLQLGKSVQLEIKGEDVKVDYARCQTISDSLVHLVRNAIDHGIELPEERAKQGKVPKAKVKIEIRKNADDLVIQISDDGRGIDPDKIKQKALSKKLKSEDALAKMTSQEIMKLIFESGFSTAEKISEVSGRGVGLDMVMNSITALRGTIELESQIGLGSQFKIILPDKKESSIVASLIVGIDDFTIAIPQEEVVEIKKMQALINEGRVLYRGGEVSFQFGNQFIAVTSSLSKKTLRQESVLQPPPPPSATVIFLKVGEVVHALAVKEIFSIERVVVKGIENPLASDFACQKAAISGRFGLILFMGLVSLKDEGKMR